MRFAPRRALAFACLLLAATLVPTGTRAQNDPVTQAFLDAETKFRAGQYAEAATDFAAFLKNYPSSGVLPKAQLFLGYSYFLSGEIDKAIPELRKASKPPAGEDVIAIAALVLPQALVQKGGTEPPGSPQRKKTLEEALALFDAYLKKYPQSEEAETLNYQRAVAAFQLEKFDDAIAALRDNLTKFGRSESIFDSQFLLGLASLNKGAKVAQDAQGQLTAEAAKLFDEAERFFADIVAKRVDVALMNDAHMQLGDLLSLRSAYAATDQRAGLIDRAMEEYRAVESKERMMKAQQDRLTAIQARYQQALQAGDLALQKRIQSFLTREAAKLGTLKEKPDQTIAAKIKLADLYVRDGAFDAARVVLRFVEPFAEEAEQKKRILFNLLLSYSQQVGAIVGPAAKKELMAKALELNEQFQAAYKGDPLADGLPLVLGSMYLDPTEGINDPAKAAEYFAQAATKGGPIGRQAAMRQAAALVQLKKYDEALAAYEKILTEKPPEAQAAEAKFGIAAMYREQARLDEAMKGFDQVRKEHASSAQAEQAEFWVGQLLLQKGQPKEAIIELKAFAAKRPESPLAPGALFALGKASQAAGDSAGAVSAFQQLAEKHPQSDAAPFSYFERAAILGQKGQGEQMTALLRDFIEKFPQSPQLYMAHSSIAQYQQSQKDLPAAAQTYRSLVEQHPTHPQAPDALLQIATLWHQSAQAMGQYVLLDDARRAEWDAAVKKSVEAVEELLEKYPESGQVANGLQLLLSSQKLLFTAKQTTADGIEDYLGKLAEKFASKPGTRSKILFTLASFVFERDAAKALAIMGKEYKPELKYAPGDLDLYGSALLAEGKVEDSMKVYQKLATDYPIGPNSEPAKAALDVQQAQAISLYGIGQALQKQEKSAEALESFEKLKALYPWHPKLLEANYGIARSRYEKKEYDKAMEPLLGVIRATNADASLRARAMLLGGKIQEALFEQANAAKQKKEADAALGSAIDYYKKIAPYFESETAEASEGLWRAGQLLEILHSRL